MKISIGKSLVLLFLAFFNLSCATISTQHIDNQYFEALKEVKAGNIDFAFMLLKNYLRENPASIYGQQVKFAIAEYYLQLKNYREAIPALIEYIKDYPEDKSTLIARVLLYKAISDYNQEPILTKDIKERFFSKSLFLVFSESKMRSYESILNNVYKIIDYVDRVEIYKNDELFLKITP